MNKKITIIGTGMDGAATMTREGTAAVAEADYLMGAKRMLAPFVSLGKPAFVSYKSDEIAKEIGSCPYQTIAVLVSGDVGFYSAAKQLYVAFRSLEYIECNVIPGISTPAYLCAKLKLPWADMKFVSLHGASAGIVRNICANRRTFFLLGGSVTPATICRRLCEYGRGDIPVHIGENLSLDGERILSGQAKDFTEIKTAGLCALIAENADWERSLRIAVDDTEFIRGGVPMTKAEVRGLCVAKLEIGTKDVCWDIGCGTGSVSVEMAMRCPDGQVIALDQNEEAIALTDQNRHKFGCDNMELIHASAQEAVEDLPSPDCVFVGGSGGHLKKILAAAAVKNPHVKVIVTAVSLETVAQCPDIFSSFGWEAEITQIAVTRTRKIGGHMMLSAENPIFIMKRKTT